MPMVRGLHRSPRNESPRVFANQVVPHEYGTSTVGSFLCQVSPLVMISPSCWGFDNSICTVKHIIDPQDKQITYIYRDSKIDIN